MTEDKFRKICDNVSNLRIVRVFGNDGYENHSSFINFVLKKVR